MSTPQSVKKLSKFLHYVLGCRPDEFGLVTDPNGYVPLKELLKALNEEDGWRHIRLAHINEVVLSAAPPTIEVDAHGIRAADRSRLPLSVPAANPPKLLYACVRPRAHPAVLHHGLKPNRFPLVILAAEPSMAERIGKRFHPSPVLLTVHVSSSVDTGVEFARFGEGLFLVDQIPPECISGPPLPKEAIEPKKTAPAPLKMPPKHPGSIILDKDRFVESPAQASPRSKRKGRDKDVGWKKDRKRIRRQKERTW